MKTAKKIFRLSLMAATAVFIARGAGHVPRSLLLISSDSEIVRSTVQGVALAPAPQPAMPLARPRPVVASVPSIPLPSFSDPALALLGDRSPPFLSRSLPS